MDGYSSSVPAFLNKLWTLVEDPETNDLICWSVNGTSFHVFDQGRFAKEVLPKYFKHNNMASFVRQLNMYGFRKVVNIEQSGLVKPERDDTEFQHVYFLHGQEHLLEHIRRKVSVVKSEETKIRQEDVSKLLYDMQLMRGHQESMDCRLKDMKHQNEVLWREVVSLQQKHSQQQKVINKLIQFLVSQLQSNHSSMGLKRKLSLMLDDNSPMPPVTKYGRHLSIEPHQDPYFIHLPSTEAALCSTAYTNSPVSEGPIISDITDLPQPSGATSQPARKEQRNKASDHMQNIEMNMDGLQSVLRSQEYSLEHSTIMHIFNPTFPLNELNLSNMEANLAMIQKLNMDPELRPIEPSNKALKSGANSGKPHLQQTTQHFLPEPHPPISQELSNLDSDTALFELTEESAAYFPDPEVAQEEF
ncbi:heat shock factor protein 4 isoform X3 [Hemitrygon akajei]|uniref:heat shock factor protein 4 isoform X3 n=1 Tax=Hemitrygon akajei TaxID=2704970 RepID=UPI003BF99ABA